MAVGIGTDPNPNQSPGKMWRACVGMMRLHHLCMMTDAPGAEFNLTRKLPKPAWLGHVFELRGLVWGLPSLWTKPWSRLSQSVPIPSRQCALQTLSQGSWMRRIILYARLFLLLFLQHANKGDGKGMAKILPNQSVTFLISTYVQITNHLNCHCFKYKKEFRMAN